jgi:hypothetical protein
MKMRFAWLALTITAGAVAAVVVGGPREVLAAAPAPAACAFPTAMTGSPEETAWRIFVAANCQAKSGNHLTWEGWIEQDTLYPAGGLAASESNPARLHGSPLARALMAKKAGLSAAQLTPSTECNKMAAPPSNVTNPIICEEVRLDPTAETFVSTKKYELRPGQTKAAQAGANIQFPTPAIEIKVDWIPGTDYTPPFTCANPPQGVHVETIGGKCYAMAGIHIASKLAPDWIWATFEPQSMKTNPNRCITFGACNDSWGSVPPASSGGASGFTAQSPALKALMASAHLAPEFSNYRMDGAQTQFGTAAQPTLLGNSIIEGENVGMTAGTASCITCHSVSSIQNNGTDGINTLAAMPTPPVGPRIMPAAGWIARDFVWSLGLACPNGPGAIGSLQTCAATAPPAGKMKKDKAKPTGS